MASSDQSVPVIDMHVSSGDLTEKLMKACEEWGCFRIINHGVPSQLMSEMMDVSRSLLDLPTEIKLRNSHPESSKGYTPPNMASPFFEGLSIYDITNPGSIDHFIHQLDASPYQRKVISEYYVSVSELAKDIWHKLCEGLGVAFNGFEDWICQMKINKYNYSPETVGLAGAVMHTDPGLFTLLRDDEVIDGLEVVHKYTKDLVSVHPIPSTFVINIGDAGRVWSNGRFHNVKHRVQCYEPRNRYSLPFFVLCPRDHKIETAKEFLDSQHPLLYCPFDFEDYRKARISNRAPTGGALELFRAPKPKTSETKPQLLSNDYVTTISG